MNVRRTALITGASRGIGLAIARRLAADGFHLTIAARSLDRLAPVAAELRENGGRIEAVAADMAVDEEVCALADAHAERFGALDALVLSAGIGSAGDIADYPMRRFDRQIAVNVRAPFLLVQRLMPALRAAAEHAPTGSKVIAIASIAGVAAEPGLAAYGASKAALISLCESITVAEGERGVSATAISPGYVDTEMSEWVRERIDPATMIAGHDVAEIVAAITCLSRWATVPNVVLTRPGPYLWRA